MTRTNEIERYWTTVGTRVRDNTVYAIQQKEVLIYIYGREDVDPTHYRLDEHRIIEIGDL